MSRRSRVFLRNVLEPGSPVPADRCAGPAPLLPGKGLCSNTRMEHRARRRLGPEQAALLRQIPSVDELLHQPRLAKLAARIPRELLVEVAREVLSGVRDEIAGESR